MTQYILQFMLTRGIGEKAIKKILLFSRQSGYSIKSISESPEMIASVLGHRVSIQQITDNIRNNIATAEEIAKRLEKDAVQTITENDDEYPHYLKECLGEDSPPVLFIRGNRQLLSRISIGFCGSRKVSEKGAWITGQCAEQLAEQKITVVSGYASGTDMAAHSSALKNNGDTVFVLAEGILNSRIKQQVRPYLNRNNHLFVSQFLPTEPWTVGNAMKRNGLIIGLSRAMILVESGKSGGTFAAGEETLQRGKPLFVIDFEKPEVSAEANPYFITHGGNPIRGKNGVPYLEKVISTARMKTSCKAPEQIAMDSLVFSN